MSTPAVIRVEGFDAVELYKHFDGYPEATLQWLKQFNKRFYENRGDDPNYKFAQLIRSSVKDAQEFDLDISEFTGWGVSIKDDFFYNFLYILKQDGTVTVTVE